MTTILFTQTGLNTWTVPSDWSNSNNYFEAIGGGAGGVTEPYGGGGGAYASSNNLSCTPGQTIYIYVGAGGITPSYDFVGVDGQNTWISISGSNPPVDSSHGVLAGGGFGGDYYIGPGNGGIGYIGQYTANGGNGSGEDLTLGGAGGGAGGPHGVGQAGYIDANNFAHGGYGDASYGGAGGVTTNGYSALNAGQPGANNGAGGGGAHDYFATVGRGGKGLTLEGHQYGNAGSGGLYGGGGGSTKLGSTGAQGIAKITYGPYVQQPTLPPPTSNTPPPACVPSGFDTATPAQIYWQYGAWSDLWNNVSSAHYDSNYQKLLSLAADNDTSVYDTQYNDTTLPWNIINEQENFYLDFPRVWKSRSNEWVDDAGQKSIWMRHRTQIGDSDCVPNIDNPSGYVTLLTNLLFMDEQTYGFKLTYANNNGYFNPGDIITQEIDANTNISGTVYMMDPNYIYVNIPIGTFLTGYNVINAYDSTINASVTAVTEIDEKYSANVFPGQSRYICKATNLPAIAEDLQIFMTAYRPANTNFKVYGKIINSTDSDSFSKKIWSRLSETSNSTTSFSALTNQKDYIPIMYDMPQSQLIFSNLESCACNTTSLDVTVPTNIYFAAGEYIYLTDPSTGAFNVRKIVNIPNNSTLAISLYPSFSNTANLNIGVIPGLEDPQGAFRYDQNSNIIRYVNTDDIYFDMFNQFAVKIVPISDNPVVCPVVTEFRGVALQASI